MAERDVTLKISAKPAPGAGDGFKKLANDANQAKQATDKLDSGFRKLASGVAGIGAIALSSDKDVKKLLETMIAFRSVIDIFEGISAAIRGATIGLKSFAASTGGGVAGGLAGGRGGRSFAEEIGTTALGEAGGTAISRTGGKVFGKGAAAGVAGTTGVGLLARFGPRALAGALASVPGGAAVLGAGALAASAFPEATAGLFGLGPDEKINKQQEARQKFITQQREQITANAQKLFDLQEKLNAAIKEESKLRTDALTKQRDQLKDQQRAAEETVKSARENAEAFGILDPLERLSARNIARRLGQGQGAGLSGEELQFAKGLPFLRQQVEAFATQQAQQSPIFQEINQLAGGPSLGRAEFQRQQLAQQQALVEQRLQAEEAFVAQRERQIQAQVNQAIQITIAQSPESLASQIARAVLPELLALQQKTVASFQKQIQDALQNLRSGSRASFGIVRQP